MSFNLALPNKASVFLDCIKLPSSNKSVERIQLSNLLLFLLEGCILLKVIVYHSNLMAMTADTIKLKVFSNMSGLGIPIATFRECSKCDQTSYKPVFRPVKQHASSSCVVIWKNYSILVEQPRQ